MFYITSLANKEQTVNRNPMTWPAEQAMEPSAVQSGSKPGGDAFSGAQNGYESVQKRYI